jgi:hypothetical protein
MNKGPRRDAVYILLQDPICLLESNFFFKVNFGKVNYFIMFGSVMEKKLENTFQCLVMLWKIS